MKIQGKKIEGANTAIIPIPRASSEDIILKVQAILDMLPFEKICPPPEPPKRMIPGGKEVVNVRDPGYLAQVDKYAIQRLNWIVLTSLEATEDLEWDTVDMANPTTWNNFRKEMQESGFSNVEINRVVAECINVNALNEAKIEEARERFLLEAQELDEE